MSSGYRVPAVVATMKVLRELRRIGDDAATQSELVRATGLSKSTMHNLLSTLEEERVVSRDPRTREYRLGPALITLGAAASGQTRLIDIAGERLAPLATELELSFAIAQPIGASEAVIVERFYPPEGVHVGIRLGSAYGIFDGAIGKCLLAALPAAEAERAVSERVIPAHTPQTVTRRAELLDEVGRVRRRGWGTSVQELNENNAVAALVRGRNGALALLLIALGFAEQLGGERIDEVGAMLAELGEQIRVGAGLGYEEGDGAAGGGEMS